MTAEVTFEEIINKPVITEGIKEAVLVQAKGVERQVVTLNQITPIKRDYYSRTIRTKELLDVTTDRVALFANEYKPEHLSERSYIQYFLTVNGQKIKVVPINSLRPGVKIVKYSTYDDGSDATVCIGEAIKSVTLEIVITTESQDATPHVGNIKLIKGKGVNE